MRRFLHLSIFRTFSPHTRFVGLLLTLLVLSPQATTTALAQNSGVQEYRKDLREGPSGEADNEFVKEAREQWMLDRLTSGDVKDAAVVRQIGYENWLTLPNKAQFQPLAAATWQQVGGSQDGYISGRAKSIGFDPNDVKIVYIATAQGGIYKTNDITATPVQWISLSDKLPSLAMGAIAVDPIRPNVIWAGTGETVGGYSTPAGAGLFKSEDGGLNWTQVQSNSELVGNNVSMITVDPINPQNVYVATGSSKGIVATYDGGAHWYKLPTPSSFSSPVSIVVNSNDNRKVLASSLTGGRIVLSEDSGKTWSVVTLPSITGGSRAMLAMAPSNPDIVYAGIVTGGGSTSSIYKTEDFGKTWTLAMLGNADARNPGGSTHPNYLYNKTQGDYANSITVNPSDPSRIVVGGLEIYTSNDGGQNLTRRSYSYYEGSNPQYVHADIQYLTYDKLGTLYAATDGGIAVSKTHGTSWEKTVNGTLATLQFVGVDADKALTFVVGGCQDNGFNKSGAGAGQWSEIHGADCGWARVPETSPSTIYGTSLTLAKQSLSTFIKSKDGGQSWVVYGNSDDLAPGLSMPFYPRYDVSGDGSFVALGASGSVYVSQAGGEDNSWVKGVSTTGGNIGSPGAVYISKYDAIGMWAGMSNSKIWRSQDAGATWESASITPSIGSITDIVAATDNFDQVYAVSSGVSANNNFVRSDDGGVTWQRPATNLPPIPFNAITRNPKNGDLFIGSDFGVLYSKDNGVTWSKLDQGLPLVQVLSLRVRGNDNEFLVAGTFGKGAYTLRIDNLGSVQREDAVSSITLGESYPNPAIGASATIQFELKHAGLTRIALSNLQGQEVRLLTHRNFPAGSSEVSFVTRDLANGTYFYSLEQNGEMVSRKLVINH